MRGPLMAATGRREGLRLTSGHLIQRPRYIRKHGPCLFFLLLSGQGLNVVGATRGAPGCQDFRRRAGAGRGGMRAGAPRTATGSGVAAVPARVRMGTHGGLWQPQGSPTGAWVGGRCMPSWTVSNWRLHHCLVVTRPVRSVRLGSPGLSIRVDPPSSTPIVDFERFQRLEVNGINKLAA